MDTKFKKNRVKSGGRKKGTPNRSTKEIQDRLKLIIDSNMDKLLSDFDELEPLDRVKTLSAYLKYVMPTYSSQALDVSLPEGKVNIHDESVVNSIIESMKKESNK